MKVDCLFTHDFAEEYYGDRCVRCGLFYAFGCAPWDSENEENEDIELEEQS